MTVAELITLLRDQDPHEEVQVPSRTGGWHTPSVVYSEQCRDAFDSDWDSTVVRIE